MLLPYRIPAHQKPEVKQKSALFFVFKVELTSPLLYSYPYLRMKTGPLLNLAAQHNLCGHTGAHKSNLNK